MSHSLQNNQSFNLTPFLKWVSGILQQICQSLYDPAITQRVCVQCCFPLMLLLLFSSIQTSNAQVLQEVKTYRNKKTAMKHHPDLERPRKELLTREKLGKKQIMTVSKSKSGVIETLNTFIYSPANNGFIGYYEYEGPVRELYFFSPAGQVRKKYDTYLYPHISYTENGMYVVALNMFGKHFMIFTHTGDSVTAGNYQELVKSIQYPLKEIFLSNDGQTMYIHTSKMLYAFDIDHNLLWQAPSERIVDCMIEKQKDHLIVQTIAVKDGQFRRNLRVCKNTTGHEEESIEDVESVKFTQNHHVVVKRKNKKKYYEYEVR